LSNRNFIFRVYELRMVVANLKDLGYGYVAKMKEWEESIIDRNDQDLVYDPIAMLVVSNRDNVVPLLQDIGTLADL